MTAVEEYREALGRLHLLNDDGCNCAAARKAVDEAVVKLMAEYLGCVHPSWSRSYPYEVARSLLEQEAE